MTYLNVSADCRPGFCSQGTRQRKQVYLCHLGSSAHGCEQHGHDHPAALQPHLHARRYASPAIQIKLFCKRFVRLKKKKKDEKPNRFEFSVVHLSSLRISLLAQQMFLGLT